MNQTSLKIRRKFDEAFKREAVQNWLQSGKPADTVARELGLTSSRLYAWRQRFAPPDAPGKAALAKPATLAEAQAQLDAAQAEIRHLREQRDILKKTLGILSEPQPSAIKGSTL